MYGYQDQNSELTLQEGLEEFYSINPNFKLLSDKEGKEGLFYQHDITHIVFGLNAKILKDLQRMLGQDVARDGAYQKGV